VKMAAFLLHGKISCVDGRDDHGVVGTPGGDAGEFLLALGALEALAGQPIDEGALPGLLASYLDTFGHFYMHTDLAALNRFIASMRADPEIAEADLPSREAPPTAWRRFMAAPPAHVRERVIDHLIRPEHVGCGHLRLMMLDGATYGVRRALCDAFLRAFFRRRWEGAIEIEFLPLGGSHREGAVVNVHLGEEIWPFSRIPLVSPSCAGSQMFVNHPEVAAYLRRQIAAFMTQRPDLPLAPGDRERLEARMHEMARAQLSATLGALAKGLPVYDVNFVHDRCISVAPA
jgi:hypothetical protein